VSTTQDSLAILGGLERLAQEFDGGALSTREFCKLFPAELAKVRRQVYRELGLYHEWKESKRSLEVDRPPAFFSDFGGELDRVVQIPVFERAVRRPPKNRCPL
jgi:hypothetical protein